MTANTRILLLLILTFGYTGSYGQTASIKYDASLNCTKLLSEDTIKYYYEDPSGNPYYKVFPINSSVAFKTDSAGSFDLHTSSAEIVNDSLKIYFTRQRFGQVIDVKIFLYKGRPSASAIYWTALGNQSRQLKVKRMTLTLSKKELETGDDLIGKVNIRFSGKIFDENEIKDKKINGEVDGCFNVQINKLLRSRLE